MTDTPLFSSAARSAPNQTVRSTASDRAQVQITKAPENFERSASSGRSERSDRTDRSDRADRSDRTVGNTRNTDRVSQERVVRGRVEAVSDDGQVRLSTSEGDFELQITDLRVVKRLQAEIARRVVEIELVIPPASQTGQTVAVDTAEIVVLSSSPERDAAYRSPPLSTPVQVEISDSTPIQVSVDEAVRPLLDVRQNAGLPDQAIRVEAVVFETIAPYLTASGSSQDTFVQVNSTSSQNVVLIEAAVTGRDVLSVVPTNVAETLSVTSALPVVLPTLSASVAISEPVAALLPDSPAAQILQSDFAGPLSVETSLTVNSVTAFVAAAPASQNAIVVSSGEAPILAVPQRPYIQLDATQALTQRLDSVDGFLSSISSSPSSLSPENLILNNVQAASTQAIILGRTPENLPLIAVQNTAGGESLFFVLHYPVGDIIPGTEISFIPVEGGSASSQVAASTVTPGPMALPLPFGFLSPDVWPAMTGSLQALQQTAPAVAQVLSALTPSASSAAQMTPAAMFFMAAVGAGDLSHWLGSKHIETLRRSGQAGSIERLGQDIQGLSRLGSEPVSQDWRAMALPLLWENEIHKVVIHYKRDDGEGDEQDPQGKQTRFVLDLDLGSMGAVQVDTLFKPGRLDTIVRTHERFSEVMHAEMRRLYTDALKLSEMGGELSFQNEPDQWVKILRETQGASVRV